MHTIQVYAAMARTEECGAEFAACVRHVLSHEDEWVSLAELGELGWLHWLDLVFGWLQWLDLFFGWFNWVSWIWYLVGWLNWVSLAVFAACVRLVLSHDDEWVSLQSREDAYCISLCKRVRAHFC